MTRFSHRRLCLYAILVVGGVYLCAWLGGRNLVEAAYQGRSLAVFNALITGQNEHSLAEYLASLNRLFVTVGLLVVLPFLMAGLLCWLLPERQWMRIGARLRAFAVAMGANWTKIYFSVSVALLVFLGAMAIGVYRVFPANVFVDGLEAVDDWRQYWRHYLGIRPDKFLKPARKYRQAYLPAKISPGITFITGMFGGSLGMKLLDMEGRVLHEWWVSYNEIWPDAQHMDSQPADRDTHVHGAVLYPSGDVVFNFEGHGLVRIDKCAGIVWKLPRKTHHAVYKDDDGNLWVPATPRGLPAEQKQFPEFRVALSSDSLLRVSSEGEVLEEISILDMIYDSGMEGYIMAGLNWRWYENPRDVTHFNDVELLEPELAEAFASFAAGDIMISLRSPNLVMVIDRASMKAKWAMIGPWLQQHDPDFIPDGRISVFDNRATFTDQVVYESSRIVQVDPASRTFSVAYEGSSESPFYTEVMGKHQYLSNGNYLITEAQAGRAFEVTRDGEIVWSYVNKWDENTVALIEEATRYPLEYAEFAQTPCP